jgi:hypothetical protein
MNCTPKVGHKLLGCTSEKALQGGFFSFGIKTEYINRPE